MSIIIHKIVCPLFKFNSNNFVQLSYLLTKQTSCIDSVCLRRYSYQNCKRDIHCSKKVELALEKNWGQKKQHRLVKLKNINMSTPESEVILAPLRASVKEQVIFSKN